MTPEQIQFDRISSFKTLAELFSQNRITDEEFMFLRKYNDQIRVLVSPANKAWNGSIRDWQQLHAAFGIAGELIELQLEVDLKALVKEFGDLLFYNVMMIDWVPNGWAVFKAMREDNIDPDGMAYSRSDTVTAMNYHQEIIVDTMKRKMFYCIPPAPDWEIMMIRNVVNSLVFMKSCYQETLNTYDVIGQRLIANLPPEDQAQGKIDFVNIYLGGDETYFTDPRDLTSIGRRNLNKLLTGKNARYASGAFSKDDAIAKKDTADA